MALSNGRANNCWIAWLVHCCCQISPALDPTHCNLASQRQHIFWLQSEFMKKDSWLWCIPTPSTGAYPLHSLQPLGPGTMTWCGGMAGSPQRERTGIGGQPRCRGFAMLSRYSANSR